jgi:hypothetical protein
MDLTQLELVGVLCENNYYHGFDHRLYLKLFTDGTKLMDLNDACLRELKAQKIFKLPLVYCKEIDLIFGFTLRLKLYLIYNEISLEFINYLFEIEQSLDNLMRILKLNNQFNLNINLFDVKIAFNYFTIINS